MRQKVSHWLLWVSGGTALALMTIPRTVFAVEEHAAGESLPLFLVSPFAGLLLTIAILPLIIPHWWESNRNKGIVSGLFGVPMAVHGVHHSPRFPVRDLQRDLPAW
jgi:hypothetical protein